MLTLRTVWIHSWFAYVCLLGRRRTNYTCKEKRASAETATRWSRLISGPSTGTDTQLISPRRDQVLTRLRAQPWSIGTLQGHFNTGTIIPRLRLLLRK
ncbi:predicted protein [Plenodomus lingam JN3]|uniref:Predicted protein n=1 Tax=Leptosphaeria maculans (strain JN3 / isolate v23.1.3 / race Av1-4-5-6-7-8) TaxID=985895 RepID=E4ZJB7_LEPMJ|nr:predicted protein [Plenodomus lingam JN3]CBX91548.1 predicted protein [Plenodomus lingam JN3]